MGEKREASGSIRAEVCVATAVIEAIELVNKKERKCTRIGKQVRSTDLSNKITPCSQAGKDSR